MNFILEALILSSALVAGVAANEPAATNPVDLKVGDPAPKFAALDDTGKEWKSEDHVGKNIMVVYFYPADMTGGCTKQACGFRDDLSKLKEQGVEVVGVSGDNVENHQVFKKAYELNFALLADTEGKVANAFGVPTGEGGTYNATVDGKEVPLVRGVTIKRWTFVIGKDGKIASKNTEVNAAEDSKAILDTVAKLQKK
jgi:peroxiredoxin Q/BCP